MEDEKAFTLYLAKYQEADLGDNITFMINFRNSLQTMMPSDVITLQTVYHGDIAELLQKVLPDYEPHDLPTFECVLYAEPANLHSDYLEQEAAKGKRAFIQALWTSLAKPKLYRLAYKAWRQHGPQHMTAWTVLAQAVLDGCYGLKWPESVFQVPESCSNCLSPLHWPERTHSSSHSNIFWVNKYAKVGTY